MVEKSAGIIKISREHISLYKYIYIYLKIYLKISKIPNGLAMVDKVMQDQLDLIVIKNLEDLASFVQKDVDCMFIAHKFI